MCRIAPHDCHIHPLFAINGRRKFVTQNTTDMNNVVYPCLTIKGKIDEAADFYLDAFGDGVIVSSSPIVKLLHLSGQAFMLLNDGPGTVPNPAISFMVTSRTPEETDRYWSKLSEGGSVMMALDAYPWSAKYGWLQDKYGVSWQLMTARESEVPQKFCPTFMFTGPHVGQAKAAIDFYTQLFPQSGINGILHYAEGEGDKTEYIKHAQFSIKQYLMMAMDSTGPHNFNFVDAVSIVMECEDQAEIDRYWSELTANGGFEVACGWLVDRFGVSWQIIPRALHEWLRDPERAQRMMQRLFKMKKLIIAELASA